MKVAGRLPQRVLGRFELVLFNEICEFDCFVGLSPKQNDVPTRVAVLKQLEQAVVLIKGGCNKTVTAAILRLLVLGRKRVIKLLLFI